MIHLALAFLGGMNLMVGLTLWFQDEFEFDRAFALYGFLGFFAAAMVIYLTY